MRILFFETWITNSIHTHTWKILSTTDFELDTRTSLLAGIYLVTDTCAHAGNMFLDNEFEVNTNTYTSKNHRELKMYLFLCAWHSLENCVGFSFIFHSGGFSKISRISLNSLPRGPIKAIWSRETKIAERAIFTLSTRQLKGITRGNLRG